MSLRSPSEPGRLLRIGALLVGAVVVSASVAAGSWIGAVLVIAVPILGLLLVAPMAAPPVLLLLLPFHEIGRLYLDNRLDIASTTLTAIVAWKEATIAVGLAAMVIWGVTRRARITLVSADLLLAGLLLWALIRVPTAENPGAGLWEWRNDFFPVLVYFLGRGFSAYGSHIARRLLTAICALGAVLTVGGLIIQEIGPSAFYSAIGSYLVDERGQLIGTFADTVLNTPKMASILSDPPAFGAYMMLASIGFLALALHGAGGWRRNRLAIGLGLTLVGQFMSFAKASWLGVVAAALLMVFVGTGGTLRRRLLLPMAILAVGAIFLQVLFPDADDRDTYLTLVATGQHKYVQGHLEDLLRGPEILLESPQGRGMGTSGYAVRQYDHGEWNETWYWQIGIQLGVLGVALFVAAQVAAIRRGIRMYREAADERLKPVLLAGSAGALAMCVAAVFLPYWIFLVAACTAWFWLGFCQSTARGVVPPPAEAPEAEAVAAPIIAEWIGRPPALPGPRTEALPSGRR